MEIKNYPLSPSIYKSGLIVGSALILYHALLHIIGFYNAGFSQYMSFAILFIGILITSQNYRKNNTDGTLSYGRAFTYGLLTTIIASVLLAIFNYVFLKYFAHNIIEEMRIKAEENLINQNRPDQEIEMAVKFITPGVISISTVFSTTAFGLLLSLITSIFAKNENPVQNPDQVIGQNAEHENN